MTRVTSGEVTKLVLFRTHSFTMRFGLALPTPQLFDAIMAKSVTIALIYFTEAYFTLPHLKGARGMSLSL